MLDFTLVRGLCLLAAATLLRLFFRPILVASLIPRLATVFHVSLQTVGLVVPACLIAYGIATLLYGVLSDRFGRGAIMYLST